ncbi:toll/interleukin-1 receptor domain-containing protein [Nocardioides lijunqiniae]|uniref:toll/interleukin-1 receptor domain-containing protein n=1 Tax=Nocardioides lijunqiniae TaxID=2760832 RepID=UPI001D0C17A9|nr:toll/interleukin-1 receptor domain-containing protein [Nocardioides lijunqiniae]
MSEAKGKHVFVSYVHEDAAQVDALCSILEAAQIPYWRDRKSLGPGDAWKAKIRDAIRDGSLVFLACFSENSRAKDKSHMNEELTLAVEEYRKRPPGRTWLIPVRFDGGDVPEWDLGAGRTLSDLNYSDLFGPRYAPEAASLATTIHNVIGEKQLSPAAALEAVEQATSADRADLLKRLTKEMLVDPARRIELDDLVSQEVQRVLAVLTDADRVAATVGGTGNEQVVRYATEAQDLWELTKPFCASLQVAARWGSPDELVPWSNGIRSFVQAATKITGGTTALLEMRHLPGVVSIMAAGLACASNRRWDNLKVLVADTTIRDRHESKPLGLLEATSPHAPFDQQEWTTNTLARSVMSGISFEEAIEGITSNRLTKFYTPAADWMFAILRPIFQDQLPDEDSYAAEFDRAEVILGVLAQDLVNVRLAVGEGRGWGRSRWFGRSTWRHAQHRGNALEDLKHEAEREGAKWGPLRADLFGGERARAESAISEYQEIFERISMNRF